MEKEYSVRIGEQLLVFRTGKVARQANGAVMASHGETVVLTTACVTDTPRTGIDFFPLLVDFEERYYSAGKIPGGFIKREGRPSESAILSARVADRSIRSLFDDAMRNDVHVVSTVMAMDQIYPPNVLGINARRPCPSRGSPGAAPWGRCALDWSGTGWSSIPRRLRWPSPGWSFWSPVTTTASPWWSPDRRRSPRRSSSTLSTWPTPRSASSSRRSRRATTDW